MMTYDEADKAIKAINRQNLRIFGKLKTKLAKWDELNVIKSVYSAYNDSIDLVEQWFLQVAKAAYLQGLKDTDKASLKKRPIDRDWLIDYLMAVDPVTLYAFLSEADRKKARLLEALSVAQNRDQEVDKALRLWTRQIGWGAVSVTDAATVKAFKDAGVQKVMWVSKKDPWVCEECHDRDGMIYEISKVPPKPHPNCRCKLRPVLDKSK